MEELGQRMSDTQIDEILACVAAHLPAAQAGSAVVMEAPAEMEQDPATAATYYAEEAEMAEAEDAFPEEHFEHEVSGVQMEQDEDE